MKMIRFNKTFWHVVHGASVPQFEAGKDYPVNEDTQRCVARGIAEEVEVADPPAETPAPEGQTKDSEGETKPAEGETPPATAETPAADAKPAKAKK